jgi:hypothetical protein
MWSKLGLWVERWMVGGVPGEYFQIDYCPKDKNNCCMVAGNPEKGVGQRNQDLLVKGSP